jgi:hypothetical protein
MPYTECITYNQAIYDLDLFDDLKFSDVKQFYCCKETNRQNKNLDFDECDFRVDIQDVSIDEDKQSMCWRSVEISFWLDVREYDGWGEIKSKKFSKTIRYNTSSEMALIMLNMYEESDEESEEESEEEESEPERIDVADEWSNYVVPRGEMPPDINNWYQEYNDARVDEWINRDLLTPIEN